jgi:hypothetical protein
VFLLTRRATPDTITIRMQRFSDQSEWADRRESGRDGHSNPFLRFDDGAHGDFLEWRTDLEARLRSGELSPALEVGS